MQDTSKLFRKCFRKRALLGFIEVVGLLSLALLSIDLFSFLFLSSVTLKATNIKLSRKPHFYLEGYHTM